MAFAAQTMRKLPIFILVSCSSYEAIDSIRTGLRFLHSELMQDPSAIECCELGVIVFGDDAWQVTKLCPVDAFKPPILDPAPQGGSTLGAAFSTLRAAISRDVKAKTGTFAGDFRPIVFVITDSDPRDDWRSALTNLKTLDSRMPQIALLVCGSDVTQPFVNAVRQDVTVLEMREMTPDTFTDAFKQLFRYGGLDADAEQRARSRCVFQFYNVPNSSF